MYGKEIVTGTGQAMADNTVKQRGELKGEHDGSLEKLSVSNTAADTGRNEALAETKFKFEEIDRSPAEPSTGTTSERRADSIPAPSVETLSATESVEIEIRPSRGGRSSQATTVVRRKTVLKSGGAAEFYTPTVLDKLVSWLAHSLRRLIDLLLPSRIQQPDQEKIELPDSELEEEEEILDDGSSRLKSTRIPKGRLEATRKNSGSKRSGAGAKSESR